MYNKDTEILFPLRAIPHLLDLRDSEWNCLVNKVISEDSVLSIQLGFVLQMVRLGGCVNCNMDSYRAMRGCVLCARQTIKRFKGSDEELLMQFKSTISEMEDYLSRDIS